MKHNSGNDISEFIKIIVNYLLSFPEGRIFLAGIVVVGIIGVVALLIFIIVKNINKNTDADKAQSNPHKVQALLSFLRDVQSNRWTPRSVSTTMLLQDGETAYLEYPCTLMESKSKRVYGGGGVGTRVGRFTVGGVGGVSTSLYNLAVIDEGILVFTNKRIIFNGSLQNRLMQIPKIVVFDDSQYGDAIEVALENKQKCSVFIVPSPEICGYIFRYIRTGKFDTARAEQTLDSFREPEVPIPVTTGPKKPLTMAELQRLADEQFRPKA